LLLWLRFLGLLGPLRLLLWLRFLGLLGPLRLLLWLRFLSLLGPLLLLLWLRLLGLRLCLSLLLRLLRPLLRLCLRVLLLFVLRIRWGNRPEKQKQGSGTGGSCELHNHTLLKSRLSSVHADCQASLNLPARPRLHSVSAQVW
jgi:hypothetical protein